MNSLDHSIDGLYSAFSSVPKPLAIDGCECCANEEDLRRLLSYAVRDIPPEVLTPYASSALLTVGSVDDYLYFLPRILHIHALDESIWPDVEITGRAIGSTNLPEWPAERIDAINLFLGDTIRSFLLSEQQHRIDDWMCAIGRMGIPADTFLIDIQASPEAVLVYFDCNSSKLPTGALSNAFWELPNRTHDRIVDWFYSPAIRKILSDAYGYALPDRSGG